MPRIATAWVAAALAAVSHANTASPYRENEPLRLGPASLLPGRPPKTYDRVEFAVGLAATYDNPFDPEQVALDATVRTPSGKTLKVPGFLYRPYGRSTGAVTLPIAYSSTEAAASGKAGLEQRYPSGEVLAPTGPASWRVRFSPTEPGRYTAVLSVRDRSGRVEGKPIAFVVSKGLDDGFIHVSKNDRRYFAFDDGKPYYPLGANVCWAGERGTRDFDTWFPAYGKSGANWSRLWLSPNWVTFALERTQTGIGQFDLANAWRIDYVLDLAAKNGLYLNLCIDSYNVLRDKINWPEWERFPHNRANGGLLERPGDFWTDPAMAKLYRAKLRYLVARYGWSTHVMAWELWNEVDGTADYNPEPVRAWHEQMAREIHAIDPYRHLVSTSFGMFGADAKDAKFFAMPEMDFAQTHLYNASDLAEATVRANERLGTLGKPHLVAELGADTGGPKAEDDPEGIQLHDPMWASITSAGSGGTMLWWWDSYIAPRGLTNLYSAARAFTRGIVWDREQFRKVQPTLAYAKPPTKPQVSDIVFEGGPTGFQPGGLNRPHSVVLYGGRVLGQATGILHGIGNHRPLHNPITFNTNFTHPTTLIVEVRSVSGYGGAELYVETDAHEVLRKPFVDPDGDRITDDLKQYAGDYSVEIPAGRHFTVVTNTGPDWILAGFRFKNARVRTAPPLVAWASVGNRTAIAWVRLEERTWRRVCASKSAVEKSPASILTFPRIRPGTWRCEIWDTWRGKPIRATRLTVGDAWQARVAIPPIDKDLAVKLVRLDEPRSDARERPKSGRGSVPKR